MTQGLGLRPRSEWKTLTPKQVEEAPIDRLRDVDLHARVLDYLIERLNASEEEMSKFYHRWNFNETRHQAYIHLPDWEQKVKEMNDTGKPPKAVRIVVPYSYAALSTIVTFLLHAFTGSKPLLKVQSYKGEQARGALAMETWLDYNAEHMKLVKVFWQFFYDIVLYNLGIMRVEWRTEKGMRTVFGNQVNVGPLRLAVPGQNRRRQLVTTYQGNACTNIDPFMFFPDPSVPMTEVGARGEFVFFRSYQGRHFLLKEQSLGTYKYVENVGTIPQDSRNISNQSLRTARIGTIAHAGQDTLAGRYRNNIQLDECSIEIIPKELGLGNEETPEKWLFAIANKKQIIRAEPMQYDHGHHPVVVSEPFGSSYSFGHAGISDLIGPLQDLMSWFVNAHISSVRGAINNTFVFDPSKIEQQDVLRPVDEDVKYFRLKQSAYGTDVRDAIHQLQIVDVTQNHMRDLQVLIQIANTIVGVDDVLKGIQSAGGRKTATEVRTSVEAGASRMAGLAKIISAQAVVDMTMMQSVNTQQLVEGSLFVKTLGKDGAVAWDEIKPKDFAGDFHYPVHDGTLPIDKIAMLDVWKELFTVILQDPGTQTRPPLGAKYNVGSIFEWMAQLSGISNLSQFEVEVQPDAQVDQGLAQGMLAPPQAVPGFNGAAPPQAGQRLQGNLGAT